MTRRTYGILAGVLGSALGAWWYSRRRNAPSTPTRGVTIYHNTPVAAPVPAEGII